MSHLIFRSLSSFAIVALLQAQLPVQQETAQAAPAQPAPPPAAQPTNPATGARVIKAEDIPHILSTMMEAGLYDGSGGWAWNVGLPAKSGVGGGIVAIAPGKGAIAVFAPPLDEAGNSVKAQEVIRYVAEKLNYNIFSPSSVGFK